MRCVFDCVGMMYGADVSVAQFATNLFPVMVGNIIGGAFLVGMSEVYLYHWSHERPPSDQNLGIKIGKIFF